MLQYRLFGGNSLPAGLEGFIKAAANIGSVIGQFAFGEHAGFFFVSSTHVYPTSISGYAADAFGRKAVCALIISFIF
jgi:hypothetical protein